MDSIQNSMEVIVTTIRRTDSLTMGNLAVLEARLQASYDYKRFMQEYSVLFRGGQQHESNSSVWIYDEDSIWIDDVFLKKEAIK